MPDKISFNNIFKTLEQAISITQQRHGVIASNISNIETPSYKAKDIDFQAALQQAMTSQGHLNLVRTDPGHMAPAANGSQTFEAEEMEEDWNGYNWVSIDREMTRLTENNLLYRSAVELLMRKIASIQNVIKEGGT